MTARLYVTPKTTEQNRIVRTGKSEAEVINCTSVFAWFISLFFSTVFIVLWVLLIQID